MSDERGFTLVELMVTCSIMLIAAVTLLNFFDGAIGGTADLQQSVQQQSDSRFALDQMTRELRQAYTGTSVAPVTVTSRTITLYTPDASTPMHLRKIQYRLQSDELQRSVTFSTNAVSAAGVVPTSWDFGASDGPFAKVADVRTADSFTGVTDNGVLTRVDVSLSVLNSGSRSDRVFQTSIGLRTHP